MFYIEKSGGWNSYRLIGPTNECNIGNTGDFLSMNKEIPDWDKVPIKSIKFKVYSRGNPCSFSHTDLARDVREYLNLLYSEYSSMHIEI